MRHLASLAPAAALALPALIAANVLDVPRTRL
jgi:hypothetical protein